jgi:hypothetical protein
MINGLDKKLQLMMPLVSGLLFRCLSHLSSSPFFWSKKMARHIRSQDAVKVKIDEDGDLLIIQYSMSGEDSILISIGNIQHFIEIIQMAVKDGYQGDDDEMV